MKRVLTLLAFTVCCTAGAQTIGIRAYTGFMLDGLRDRPLAKYFKQPDKVNFGAGVYYEQRLGRWVTLVPGFGWMRLRSQYYYNYNTQTGSFSNYDLLELPLDVQVNVADHPGRGWNGLIGVGGSYAKVVSVERLQTFSTHLRELRFITGSPPANDYFNLYLLRFTVEARRYFPNGRHLGIGLQVRTGSIDNTGMAQAVNDICISLKTGLRFGKPVKPAQIQ